MSLKAPELIGTTGLFILSQRREGSLSFLHTFPKHRLASKIGNRGNIVVSFLVSMSRKQVVHISPVFSASKDYSSSFEINALQIFKSTMEYNLDETLDFYG